MLQFYSASTSIVNSRRAITECLENALVDQPNLDCDLIVIYSAVGHNFMDLMSEARKLAPGARIAGCTGGGIIGKEGPDETMKALAIMAVKGSKNEIAVVRSGKTVARDNYEICREMALELQRMNPQINMIQFLTHGQPEFLPVKRSLNGIQSVFGQNIPVFGGLSVGTYAGLRAGDTEVSGFQFYDEQVIENGAVMVGYADPTIKCISHANHGAKVIEGVSFTVTRSESNHIYEIDGKPAWQFLTQTLGVPETMHFLEFGVITQLANELPDEFQKEYGSKFTLFIIHGKNEDGSIIVPVPCEEGMRIWLSKRDEKKMFEGVDWMVKNILDELQGSQPIAVFHADCGIRGRASLNRILKDEIINRLQSPICGGEDMPWLGFYAAGEFAMLGRQPWFHQMTSSLFIMYR